MAATVKDMIERYDPARALAEASTPPASWYTDPRIYELELASVFTRSWHVVGRTDQLSAPGRFVTANIGAEPILAVAGNDGVVRAFYNVCRHHAATVAAPCEGQASHLRCPYHGWTYDLKGQLIRTPEFAGVADFDRSAHGLVTVHVAQWQGWTFVKLDAGGPTLNDFFGADLMERIGPLNLPCFNWFERRSYFLNCNWKVFVDNYLDGGYHVPQIHGGLGSVLDNSNYRIETGAHYCLQSSPILTKKGDPQTAALRTGERALYFWLYPNFMLNIYQDLMDTNLVIPRGVDRTEVVFDYYFTDVSEAAREKSLASIAVSEQIQAEDVAICESVQRGLNSRAYDTGRLSVRREAGEQLFHKLLYADLHACL